MKGKTLGALLLGILVLLMAALAALLPLAPGMKDELGGSTSGYKMIFGYAISSGGYPHQILAFNGTLFTAWIFVIMAMLIAFIGLIIGILNHTIKVGPLSLDALLYFFAGLLLLAAGIIDLCAVKILNLSDVKSLGIGFILAASFAFVGTAASLIPFFLNRRAEE